MSTRQQVVVKSNPVQEKMLKFGPAGDEVARAKQAMIEAAETATTTRGGTKVPAYIAKAAGLESTAAPAPSFQLPDFAQDENPARQAQQPRATRLPAAEVRPQAQSLPEKREYTIKENKQKGYTLERWQDREGIWHAVISYASGAGAEQFHAATLAELGDRLLEGKAQGTIWVREKNRLVKQGGKIQSWADFFGLAGVTELDFNRMPKIGQNAVVNSFQEAEIKKYFADYGDGTEVSNESQVELLKLQLEMNVPMTVSNLLIMVGILKERGLWNTTAPAALPVASTTSQAQEAAATIAAEAPRKRGQVLSGIVPGRSSGTPAYETQAEGYGSLARARELARTPEGMAQLRRESIPSLNPGYKGRRS